MIDITADSHVHTSLCRHASGEMEEYVLAAIERGLHRLTFLEHLEAGISYFESTWLTDDDFVYYHKEGQRLKDKYNGRIEISLGVEVGYNPKAKQELLQKLACHPWDLVGISYHFLETDQGHLNMVSRKQTNIDALERIGTENVLRQYYQGLLQAVEEIPGNILCHLDAGLRHQPLIQLTDEHEKLIENLLDAVARKNMAVEINTSGFKLKNEPFPSPHFLKKVIERDIPLVAGSDAHRPEDVGRYFDRLPELLDELVGSSQ
jgi:histidinol-phosphatase (PHP family)